jgi:SprB repeat
MPLSVNAVVLPAVYTDAGFLNGGGSVTVTALHGVAPYTYSWSNGSADAAIVNLSPGVYALTVQDSLQQSKSEVYTVPARLGLGFSTADASAYSAQNGSVTTTVYGAVEPVVYSWSNGVQTKDQTRIRAGTYTLTVTDANAETGTAQCTVNEPMASGMHLLQTLRATHAIDVPTESYLYFGGRNVRMGFDESKGVLVIQKYVGGTYVTKIEV